MKEKRKGFFELPPNWQKLWKGMPSFDQKDLTPLQSIKVHFRNPQDRKAFEQLVGSTVTSRTQSVWYPREDRRVVKDKLFVSASLMNPLHPVYVISKGRWDSRLTSRALEKMGVPYRIVVEPQEREKYAEVIDDEKILVLPFSDLGEGSIPARNWVWEHSVEEGHSHHWILDDNIKKFFRLFNNMKIPVGCGNVFRITEDFVNRYENVAISGMNYYMFAPDKTVVPPLYLNTRIYSCILIKNDIPYRWRGRYNEDTDLSIRALKDGWCTVLMNALLAQKMPTMTMVGGNTEELYEGDGRWDMAESLRKQHPDIVRISKRWGRWQHQVDYSRFKKNKLKPKKAVYIAEGVDEFCMYLKKLEDSESLFMIGQAPSKNGDPGDPLGGKIGKRLAKLAGVSFDRYCDFTVRMNLFNEWTGKDGKGDAWDKDEARRRADALLDSLEDQRVLFVGRNVAEAFGCKKMPWLEWQKSDFASEVAVIPHPSGIVLWWNEPGNRRAAAKFLYNYFQGLKTDG